MLAHADQALVLQKGQVVWQGTTVRGEVTAPIGVVPWGEKKLNAALQSVAW